MNYTSFCDALVLLLQKKIRFDEEITLHKIEKNNHVILDGLIIKTNEVNISPTFYLNYYYDDYVSGTTIDQIADTILIRYQSKKKSKNLDISFFTDFEKVKSTIVFKLISYNDNIALLKDVPHQLYLDFAIVYMCLIQDSKEGLATILIRNEHLHLWNKSIEELSLLAKENTPNYMPYTIKSMTQVLQDLMEVNTPYEEDTLCLEETPCPMYVLTNEQKLNGAACLLYPHVLENFSKEVKSNLWIIPSSIHEIILIPTSIGQSKEELNEMVLDVNHTQVAPEEILSDHVYFYERNAKLLTC